MRLHQRVLDIITDVLHQAADRKIPIAGGLEALRSIGNVLHCASVYSLRETPQLFLRNHPAFRGKERLLGPDFHLPDQYSYIEDPVSGVGLVDVKSGQRGLDVPRFFVTVDEANPSTITQATNFKECFQALMENADAFDGTIVLHAGFITGMEAMLPDDDGSGLFAVHMRVDTVAVISPNGRVAICAEPYTPAEPEGSATRGGWRADEGSQLVSQLAGNLRCGMRELAYYQASKAQPDCRVTLERAGR